jgi:hypothetical protein
MGSVAAELMSIGLAAAKEPGAALDEPGEEGRHVL